jgi:hypothetical protein
MSTGPKGIIVGGAKARVTRRSWSRRRVLLLVIGVVLVLAGAGWASRYGSPETWLQISPVPRLTMGVPQQVSVVLEYRPRFLVPSLARPIPGTIQLISFGERVEVKPTTLVTTQAAPTAAFTVTGKHPGVEELVFAGSESPKVASTWRTMSTKTVVTKP